MTFPLWVLKAVLVAAGLAVWFWTQALIARRAFPQGQIGDRLLDFTATLNRLLWEHPHWADGVLIVTSAVIDLLGLFLVALGVFGPSIRPLVGLFLLFALRQVCQGLCALPAPERMIWRDPGFPSLLVTYGTASDLFFSGHTAIAVYGSIELAHYGGPLAVLLGLAIILVEATAVLVLRAHYTMDVFTGAVTALWVWTVASALAPGLDRSLANMLG
ncbi:MAG TPA: phosphatase PAP2-related protein [Polyangiaceae bacterium]